MAALASLAAVALSGSASAGTLHQWTFDEAAGTNMTATVNTGSAASGVAPTFNSDLDIAGFADAGTNGSIQFVLNCSYGFTGAGNPSDVDISDITSGLVYFRMDGSWNFTGEDEVAANSQPGTPSAEEFFLVFARPSGFNSRFQIRRDNDGNPSNESNTSTVTIDGGKDSTVQLSSTLSSVSLVAVLDLDANTYQAYYDTGSGLVSLGVGNPNSGTNNYAIFRTNVKGDMSGSYFLSFGAITIPDDPISVGIPEPSAMTLLPIDSLTMFAR